MKLILALMALTAATPSLAQSVSDQAAVRAMEMRQRDAVVAGDLPALERIWSPAFVVNNPGNMVALRPEVLDRVRKGFISYTDYQLSIERITFSGDLAIVMGSEDVVPKQGPEAGRTLRRRFTDVWRRDGAGWVAIARHANIAPTLPPRNP